MGALLVSVAIWAAENILPSLVAAWLKSKLTKPAAPANPVDVALGEVRAATDAAKAVDTSDKAVTDDENNRSRPR